VNLCCKKRNAPIVCLGHTMMRKCKAKKWSGKIELGKEKFWITYLCGRSGWWRNLLNQLGLLVCWIGDLVFVLSFNRCFLYGSQQKNKCSNIKRRQFNFLFQHYSVNKLGHSWTTSSSSLTHVKKFDFDFFMKIALFVTISH